MELVDKDIIQDYTMLRMYELPKPKVTDEDVAKGIKDRRKTSIWLTEETAYYLGYTFLKVENGWLIQYRDLYAGISLQFFSSDLFCEPFPDDYIARLALAKFLEKKQSFKSNNYFNLK